MYLGADYCFLLYFFYIVISFFFASAHKWSFVLFCEKSKTKVEIKNKKKMDLNETIPTTLYHKVSSTTNECIDTG